MYNHIVQHLTSHWACLNHTRTHPPSLLFPIYRDRANITSSVSAYQKGSHCPDLDPESGPHPFPRTPSSWDTHLSPPTQTCTPYITQYRIFVTRYVTVQVGCGGHWWKWTLQQFALNFACSVWERWQAKLLTLWHNIDEIQYNHSYS